jgi:hypothetical protein
MSFEVFRRHQKKLLAVFAILAMFGFVVSDSLPKLLSPNSGTRDQPVVTLYGKTIYRSMLNGMHERRNSANMFMSEINMFGGRNQFGGVKDRDLVDALILEHEADRLGLPSGPDVGREFLKMITRNQMTSEIFDSYVDRMNNRVSGDQILTLIGDQVRLLKVRLLPGTALVTPYDVFRTYRDQNERVSAKAVEIPVEKFLAKVPEPSAAEIEALYEKYKDVLPDATRETPGFKVPRQIQVEILSIDGNALARGIMDTLSEQDLRTAYENRKKEFPARSELPVDLFAGQPDLTPPILRSFDDVRPELAVKLAEDRAAAQISDTFAKIKVEVLEPFYDLYGSALDDLEEAKKKDPKATRILPEATDLKEVAQREHLNYEVTKLLSLEEADQYGPISSAQVGTVPLSGGRKFAAEFFDTRKALYEPDELVDLGRTRYLTRKIKDVAPHVPPLDEVRSDVSLAYKTIQARVLADKAASELAEKLKKKGGAIGEAIVDGYRVLSIPPITRKQPPNRIANPFEEPPPPEDSVIPDVAFVDDAFRDAYFSLQPGSFATAANQPRTVFYVMALDKREPATFAALYAPYSDSRSYAGLAERHAAHELADDWMKWLRQKAGLADDWVPPDEVKGHSASDEA